MPSPGLAAVVSPLVSPPWASSSRLVKAIGVTVPSAKGTPHIQIIVTTGKLHGRSGHQTEGRSGFDRRSPSMTSGRLTLLSQVRSRVTVPCTLKPFRAFPVPPLRWNVIWFELPFRTSRYRRIGQVAGEGIVSHGERNGGDSVEQPITAIAVDCAVGHRKHGVFRRIQAIAVAGLKGDTIKATSLLVLLIGVFPLYQPPEANKAVGDPATTIRSKGNLTPIALARLGNEASPLVSPPWMSSRRLVNAVGWVAVPRAKYTVDVQVVVAAGKTDRRAGHGDR